MKNRNKKGSGLITKILVVGLIAFSAILFLKGGGDISRITRDDLTDDNGEISWGEINSGSGVADDSVTDAYFTFIDVGQGDSSLIQMDGITMLIDTGPGSSKEKLQKTLNARGVTDIDILVLTHPHEDHIGGTLMVLENYNVKTVYRPIPNEKNAPTSKIAYNVEKAIVDGGYSVKSPALNEVIYSGKNTEIKIVNDTKQGDGGSNLNDYSIAVLVTHGNNTVLYTGDGEKTAEDSILSSNPNIKTDLLHSGHHGSNTSSNKDLVNQLNPKLFVISAGKDNKYGHPHDEIMELYESFNVPIKRTDQDGNIVFVSDGIKLLETKIKEKEE